jgi:1-acyl-sn-glycerol-3-phosphate acyltransferase
VSLLLRSKPARTVISIWSWFVLGVALFVLVPTVGLIRLATWRDAGRYKAGLMFRKVAVVHQKLNPLWKFSVSGNVPSDPRRPYVVVANHVSFVDILLISHLPFEMKWMSKTEMFKIPWVGWGMRLAGDIELDRSDARAGAHALIESRERLKNHVSVMIFPEGTRSENGELQDFKDGAFRLAVQLGLPILPLAVIGTRDALVKHDWRFGYSKAEVRVLEPIETTGLTKRDAPLLRDRTRDAIAGALSEMRAERAERAA